MRPLITIVLKEDDFNLLRTNVNTTRLTDMIYLVLQGVVIIMRQGLYIIGYKAARAERKAARNSRYPLCVDISFCTPLLHIF